MNRPQRLSEELYNSVFGDPWYGASVSDILKNISIEQAFQKSIPSTHSIIELILHMTAWTDEILSRLNGNKPSVPQLGDWPPPASQTAEYWDAVTVNLYESTKKLISAVQKFPEEKLDYKVDKERDAAIGTGFSFEGLILGLIEHNTYHLGQISLLKKYKTGI